MNVGTEQIKHKILRALKRHNANLRGIRYGAFADELAEEIYKLFGDDMLEMDLRHNIPTDVIKLIGKLEKKLGGYKFRRDDESIEVYKWILEQPEGELTKFLNWATEPERVQFVGKYRKNPGTIQFDWNLNKQVIDKSDRASRIETL